MKLLKLITIAIAIIGGGHSVTYAQSFSRLSVELSVEQESLSVGEPVSVNIAIKNTGTDTKIATNPVVTVQLPSGSSELSSPDCMVADQSVLVCALAEIGVEETVNLSISAVLNEIGHHLISVGVDADDLSGGTESDTRLVTVLPLTEITEPVDLAVETSANGDDEIKISGTANHHCGEKYSRYRHCMVSSCRTAFITKS